MGETIESPAGRPVEHKSAVQHPRPWQSFWRALIKYERNKINSWIAVRNTAGVVLPLAVGVLAGSPLSGVAIATGALNVSYSDGSDGYFPRGRRMLTATLLTSGAVLVGGMAGRYHMLAILLAALAGFAAGLFVALGQTAADLGVLSLVVLVVYSAQALTAANAGWAALLALSGGLFQTALSLLMWPVQRYQPERRALGDLYLELSRVATTSVSSDEPPPATQASNNAQQILATLGQDHRIEGERYRSLLNQAERIRLCLLALFRLRRRIRREYKGAGAAPVLDRCLEVASDLLYAVGQTLRQDDDLTMARQDEAKFGELVEEFRLGPREGMTPFVRAVAADAQLQLDALAGQLRAVLDLTEHTTTAGSVAFERKEMARPAALRLAGALATLRANLSLRSTACRHAIRLCLCVAAADTIGRSVDWRRSYWLPMTVAIVLRPDFTQTFSRGALRLVGTFAGLGVATVVFRGAHPSQMGQVVFVAIFTFLLRSVGPANYGIFVLSISALIVLLVGLTGVPAGEVIAARAVNTAAGGLLAIFAYWVWPTWEREQIGEIFARLLDAYRTYSRAIVDVYLAASSEPPDSLDRLRLATRLARTNAQASVDRLSAEPGISPEILGLYTAMLASTHRLVYALMALDAGLTTSAVPAREATRVFASNLDLTLYQLAAGLRGSNFSPRDLPDLRATHRQLLQSEDPHTQRYALVNVETDRITNSVNTLTTQISQLLVLRHAKHA